jgi:hypothetical protein
MQTGTLRYGQVEELLARLHGADRSAQTGALRGRIKHLRRLGMPFGASPGTGNKIEYEKSQIYQFSFCLELEELGLDPALIVSSLEMHKDFVLRAYASAERELAKGLDYYFFIFTAFMQASWSKKKLKFPGLITMTAGPIDRVDPLISSLGTVHERRVVVFNMTPCVREVLNAMRGD